MTKKITFSIIKADIGGCPGHSTVNETLMECARKFLKKKGSRILKDFHVTHCGDDLALIMTHTNGANNSKVHKLAWDCFKAACVPSAKLACYGVGQDLLKDAFSGNVRGMGPGCAEIEFTPRKSEPIVAFLMDKTEPGAFNLPIYKIYADPFNSPGLVIDPNCHAGFRFEVWDIQKKKSIILSCPEEMYDLLALIGAKERFVIKNVFPKKVHPKLPPDESVANISTDKLFEIAGKYVGKDDPVAICRSQSGLPALGSVIEPFSFPHLVSGWMRGSHNGPLMPVSLKNARCTRFDGPPRVVALGFQVTMDGRLSPPQDLFDDPAYDEARHTANIAADYMRRHGPFEPHRLPLADMEYTTLPGIERALEKKMKDLK